MDPNDRAENDNNNTIDDIDFDLDDHDSKNHDSEDGDGNGSDGNLGVFDFDEADVPHHNYEMHDDHEGSIKRPPFETFHTGQGFRSDHNVAMGATENVRIKIDVLQPQSDFFFFWWR